MRRLSNWTFLLGNLLAMTVSNSALSALLDRGGGLIYDTVNNITWLQDANYPATTGFHPTGQMAWHTAMSWAAGLSFYDSARNKTWGNWRLPSARETELTEPCFGFDCTQSEVGHLYHTEGIKRGAPGPFVNFQGTAYWAGTGRAPFPGHAWVFAFGDGPGSGIQDHTGGFEELLIRYVWPVRNGDIASSPLAESDNIEIESGKTSTFDITSNDSDSSNGLDKSSVVLITQPRNGTLTFEPDGLITYTPASEQTQADHFSYTIGNTSGLVSNIADVNITPRVQSGTGASPTDPSIQLENKNGGGSISQFIFFTLIASLLIAYASTLRSYKGLKPAFQ